MDQLKDEEIIVFRKRMTSMILATDMAHHMSGLNLIKDKIKRLGISKEQKNDYRGNDFFVAERIQDLIYS